MLRGGSIALGAVLAVCGVFALLMAMINGPGSSDEFVGVELAMIPWFGFPIAAVAAGVTAIAVPRLATAGIALAVGAFSLAAWYGVAAVL
jgi:hypothetical protein